MSLAFVAGHHLFKQRARYLLENLTENAGYSCQGLVLDSLDLFLAERILRYQDLAYFLQTLIWTRVDENRSSDGWKLRDKLYGKYPNIQILTIAELFDGKRPNILLVDTTSFRKAPKEMEGGEQERLF